MTNVQQQAYNNSISKTDAIKKGFNRIYVNLIKIDKTTSFRVKLQLVNQTINIFQYFVDTIIMEDNSTLIELFEFWGNTLTKSLKTDIKVDDILRESVKNFEETFIKIN